MFPWIATFSLKYTEYILFVSSSIDIIYDYAAAVQRQYQSGALFRLTINRVEDKFGTNSAVHDIHIHSSGRLSRPRVQEN